tara:strand:+ start:33 stop:446 length:414 start_codon:yes stop_codon:yes gene_type:complete
MKIESKETHKVIGSDRLIYLHRVNSKVIGLNYMQGSEDIEQFEHYKNTDKELTNFVLKRLKSHNDINEIDDLIWHNLDYSGTIDNICSSAIWHELIEGLDEKMNLKNHKLNHELREKIAKIHSDLKDFSLEYIKNNL